MSVVDWRRRNALVSFLLGVEKGERSDYLEMLCSNDPALRREVEALLKADDDAEGFLDHLIEDAPKDAAGTPLTGGRIGPYRIIEQLGSGGMGEVYRAARDDEFQMLAAIKVVKRGMDTSTILKRFRQERQILAGLHHPNITTLLDGGTLEDGRPYFVMEFVDGKPITEHCEMRSLPLKERLELFAAVCSAVHFAHQNLVVHRDLKPSNILVTDRGVPKLLDFGIAKILNLGLTASTTDLTADSTRVMTLDYASPEQVRGEPITTATDVYSLGAVLYELLTGRRAHRFASTALEAITRAICEEQVQPPSLAISEKDQLNFSDVSNRKQLQQRLKGDLDNIALKALHKDPQRRYGSVEQLAEDVRRYLDGRPVIARKDTVRYRAGKFIARYKAAVIAAAIMILLLFAGIIFTTQQARIAAAERQKAERRFSDLRKIANWVVFDLHDRIRDLSGSTTIREMLIRRASEYLDGLSKEASEDQALLREMAAAYEKLGHVQGLPGEANLGDTKGALQSLGKAMSIREKLAAAQRSNREAQLNLARLYNDYDVTLRSLGESEDHPDFLRKALAICEDLASQHPADAEVRFCLGNAYSHIAARLGFKGDLTGALENRRKQMMIFQQLAATDPASPRHRRNLALAFKNLGGTQTRLRQFDEGLASYRQALEIDEKLSASFPANAAVKMDVSFDLSDIGYIYKELGKLEEAASHYKRALEIRQALGTADPKDARMRYSLSVTHSRLGVILVQMGQHENGLRHLRTMLELRNESVRADPANRTRQFDLASGYQSLGTSYVTLAKARGQRASWLEARNWLEKSRTLYDTLAAKGALNDESSTTLEKVRKELAECDRALTRH